MTQDDFFGAIESNLTSLAADHVPLPAEGGDGRRFLGLFGRRNAGRIKQVLNLTKSDVNAPVNVRCYDLVSDKSSSCGPARFRVFACFAEAGTPDGYRQAKYAIRKWYEESGRRTSLEQPYSGALIVGAASPWPADMMPNANDMPFDKIAFRMLAASHSEPERGIRICRDGNCAAYVRIFQALVPETFSKVEGRVRACVERSLLHDGSCLGGGLLTIRKVMDELPMIPTDNVLEVFLKMQREGTHRIQKRKDRDMPKADRIYIENKPPSWWASSTPVFASKGFLLLVVVGIVALCLLLYYLTLQ